MGSVILMAIMKIRNVRILPFLRYWKEFALVGFFANALPFVLITLGQQYIPSSIAAVMNSTTPLFTVFLAHYTIKGESITVSKIAGVIIGMIGIFVIFSPCLSHQLSFNPIGAIAVLIASLSYAIGMICSKKIYSAKGYGLVKAMPAGQLACSSLLLLPIFLIFEAPHFTFSVSPVAALALIAVSFFGSAIAFLIYHHLLKTAGATFLSFATLLFPVVGIALGTLFLGEELNSRSIIGTILILIGLIVTNFLPMIIAKCKREKNG